MKEFKLLIDGKWVSAADGRTFTSTNPANGEKIATFAFAGKGEVDAAVSAAKKSFASRVWADMNPDDRAEIMLKAGKLMRERLEELAWFEAAESGKPLRETQDIDIPYSIRAMEYFANMAREINGYTIPIPNEEVFDWVSYEPYGVVAAIVPWNFPLHLGTRAVCPPLAAGNSVVFKPSSYTSATAVMMGEILVEAGMPKGVFNVITGSGGETGNALLEHPDVSMITFTGSLEIGRKIMEISARSPVMKNMVLELGGKGPFIAAEDCNVSEAVNQLIKGFCLMQGEVCCASTHLLVHEDIYQEFSDLLVERVEKIKLGDIFDLETEMGSLIGPDHLKKVDAYVKEAVKDGARLLTGGEAYTEPPCDKGSFYKPTVLVDVEPTMTCVREEIFGPVLVVQKFSDLDQAIDIANQSQYDLGATVFSENYRTLLYVAKRLESGTIWMNTNVMSKIEAPYGGDKNTGTGRENGREGLKSYMRTKNHVLNFSTKPDSFYNFGG